MAKSLWSGGRRHRLDQSNHHLQQYRTGRAGPKEGSDGGWGNIPRPKRSHGCRGRCPSRVESPPLGAAGVICHVTHYHRTNALAGLRRNAVAISPRCSSPMEAPRPFVGNAHKSMRACKPINGLMLAEFPPRARGLGEEARNDQFKPGN
ncbi:hypothetical protein MPTK1_8g16830 [Marchantia polymorpha subsp. ruderalis]|uniref:Uncharacterized protein n=1 Tax=Marchantia polymorpha TaxID=3197 RepID=A0A2R6X833_MARPO|nr:hypothetical protein MARPO_0030s0016 [Marchantia polymorpha]BBN20152.1 hypothetical protein Mp_8g16830 [Marchantia polymorpha subsp. ruderalis]|eukprot:PTQ42266.1 hypothetical protein MARPO_0030s0016 [Marchantia polymorpha]